MYSGYKLPYKSHLVCVLFIPTSSFNCFYTIQVCLMLQSWDNMANMHELFTVLSSHTQRKSIRSCMSTISTVRMQQHEFWTIDHTPQCRSTAAARTHHCTIDVLALLKRRIYHQIMTKSTPRLSLVWGTSPFAREEFLVTSLYYSCASGMLWMYFLLHCGLQLKWLLTKIIAHAPMIIALLTGAIQSRSHIAQASTAHGGHALDHTVIWLAMSTFQTWAQRSYSDVTRPSLLRRGWYPRLVSRFARGSVACWAGL